MLFCIQLLTHSLTWNAFKKQGNKKKRGKANANGNNGSVAALTKVTKAAKSVGVAQAKRAATTAQVIIHSFTTLVLCKPLCLIFNCIINSACIELKSLSC